MKTARAFRLADQREDDQEYAHVDREADQMSQGHLQLFRLSMLKNSGEL